MLLPELQSACKVADSDRAAISDQAVHTSAGKLVSTPACADKGVALAIVRVSGTKSAAFLLTSGTLTRADVAAVADKLVAKF